MNLRKRLIANHNKYPLRASKSMMYTCRDCGKMIKMYLQEGLCEGGENHKPVPFMIRCKCGGVALHAMFHLDEEYEPPVFITENMSYFKNDPKEDCGQPIVR